MADTVRAQTAEASPKPGSAPPTLQGAFSAISRMARGLPRSSGSIAGYPLPPDIRYAWLVGLRGALNESPIVTLSFTAGGIHAGNQVLELEGDSPISLRLADVGVAGLTLWRGAPDAELLALATVLCTAWRAGDERRFENEIWEANLEHAWFDCTRAQRPTFPVAPAPLGPPPSGALPDFVARQLQVLRETAAPAPGAFIDVHATTRVLPAELAAEVAALADGSDLTPAALGQAMVQAGLPTEIALQPAEDLFRARREVGPLFHALIDAAAPRAFPPTDLRDGLPAALPLEETPEARGSLFSLLHCVPADADLAPLAERLPRWAVQVCADVLLAHEIEAGEERSAARRLRESNRGDLLLGLCMAARLDDGRLTERVLALADHDAAVIRECALHAVRPYSIPRVHARVVKALDDPSTPVRVEALRYAVVHRLPAALPWLEKAIVDGLANRDDVEARAVCVAFGKLARERAESSLSSLARRRLPASRFAVHGLRAALGARARGSIELLAAESPGLADEAQLVLRDLS